MLKFIWIVCGRNGINIRISIHLMLKFIWIVCGRNGINIRISIHLMLKFILKRTVLRGQLSNFNTSHVEVYPALIPATLAQSFKFQYISC